MPDCHLLLPAVTIRVATTVPLFNELHQWLTNGARRVEQLTAMTGQRSQLTALDQLTLQSLDPAIVAIPGTSIEYPCY